ncbi:MAG: hypothetical protein IJE60_09960 [Tyzzerella sp.]|nr:hypothetical protein [Tyzzerella sp.]
MKNLLYGDGIHDDYPAIQEMIDSGVCEVVLPIPKKNYLISKTLTLPSNFKLTLPRFAVIKLADGANCHMVRNKMVPDYAERLPEDLSEGCRHLWYYVNEYSPEAMTENVEICGGIWDCNNMNQLPNPEQSKVYEPYGFTGEGMLFYGVKNLKLSSMTIKDPTHWGVSFDRVSYFTVRDITFDYNLGNPCAVNMDGIHLNGNCHFGVIRNLKGACYDDMVAINAHEGSRGTISNIRIDGLFAENCHSAVRLLNVCNKLENIHISNIYGTYYQYCIGITRGYQGEVTGVFDSITIDNIYASKALRDNIYPWPNGFVYPLIYMENEVKVKNLKITDVHRKEYNIPVETIYVGHAAVVENLIIDCVVSENHTGKAMPMLVNKGKICRLTMKNLSADGDLQMTGEGQVLNM